MALDSLVRSAVSIANSVTSSLQANVSHFAWTGFGTYGEPTFATAIVRPAIVDYKQRLRKTADGQEIMQQASVMFVGPITANGSTDRREPVDPRDKIVLPNSYTGPILNVEGVVDPSTNAPYAIEVILG